MFLYDLTKKENMILYFSLKNKKGHSIENRESVILSISKELENSVQQYDHVFIPESSSDFLVKVVSHLNKPYSIVNKNSVEYIKSKINTFDLQKSERISHLSEIENMNGSFKINELKANHRKHYIEHLFQKCNTITNSVIIDDSNFSGSTRAALMQSTGTENYIAIFSKEKI